MRNKKFIPEILLIIYLIAGIGFYILPHNAKIGMNKFFSDVILFPYTKVYSIFNHFFLLQRENELLKTEVIKLNYEIGKMIEYQIENQRLKQLLNFQEIKDYKEIVFARTVGISGDIREYGNLIIDKGKNHGIEENLPVINYEGVIGKIIQVFNETSVVQLILDKDSRLSCINQRSRQIGILEFKDNNPDRGYLNYVPRSADMQKGDKIITSNLGGVFPRGLLVGTVEETNAGNDLLMNVKIQPAADFSHTEEVFVIIR